MDETKCSQCGERKPVHNGKCENCLNGPELEAYADEHFEGFDDEVLYLGPQCGS